MTKMTFGVEELRTAYRGLLDSARSMVPTQSPPIGCRMAEVVGSGEATVVVSGSTGGVGTSTVALALAEHLNARRLVEVSRPHSSSLGEACTAELGERDGWIRGRRKHQRGELEILRPLHPASALCLDDEITVVDAGVWEGAQERLVKAMEVLVGPCTVPGARRLEAILNEMPNPPAAVALTGSPSRVLPKTLLRVLGPRLLNFRQRNRIVLFPAVATHRMAGITSDPFPKTLHESAGALKRLLED